MLRKARNEKKARLEGERDELTGLPNLKAARALIPAWVERAKENFYLVFADIDYFKSVNDCHSHQTGDFVLTAFANVASRFFGHRVFRVGGEEFLWCFKGTESEVLSKAEEFRFAVESRVLEAANHLIRRNALGRPNPEPPIIHFPITVSQGIAQAGVDGHGFEELKLKADEGVYLAKDAGRNCVVFRLRPRSRGRSPIHYTRELLGLLHQKAKQRGFTCWWKMQEQITPKEKKRLLQDCWNWTHQVRMVRAGELQSEI
jgi:diguanylate cyclase (GGDEF)-like protein